MLSHIVALGLTFALAQNSPAPAAPAAVPAKSGIPAVTPTPGPVVAVPTNPDGTAKILPASSPCLEASVEFCKGKKMAKGELSNCLMEHRDRLSAQCVQLLDFMKAAAAAMPPQCREESRKMCGNLKAGEGKTFQSCMNENRDKFSAFCKKKNQEFMLKYTQKHSKKFQNGGRPTKVPTKIVADPDTVKPPPPPPQKPPPEGFVQPAKKVNRGSAKTHEAVARPSPAAGVPTAAPSAVDGVETKTGP